MNAEKALESINYKTQTMREEFMDPKYLVVSKNIYMGIARELLKRMPPDPDDIGSPLPTRLLTPHATLEFVVVNSPGVCEVRPGIEKIAHELSDDLRDK